MVHVIDMMKIHYNGVNTFVRKAFETIECFGSAYSELYVVDLAPHRCINTLLFSLDKLYSEQGDIYVLLLSREKSHLPSLGSFSINLESSLSDWKQYLQYGGELVTNVITGCCHIKNLDRLTMKSRLILRRLAAGYSVEELADQLEITVRSIQALIWRLCLSFNFNNSCKLISYLQEEYRTDKIRYRKINALNELGVFCYALCDAD